MNSTNNINMNNTIARRYTWDDIFDFAENKGFGSKELKAKDNARWIFEDKILEDTGIDINKEECPEDCIEEYIKEYGELYFDEYGTLLE